ncbi:MAG: LamB/YcsF family protein [Firmicutes bacterium]|nr:LamB/YcsF family protein [Bacillota bacterium]
MRVDINSDMGESFGPYRIGAESGRLMPHLTSANVACGFHAGDPRVMRDTVRLARAFGVGVGAHVGFPDRVGFGRRAMALSGEEIATDVLYQIGALYAFCREAGVPLRHVKAHGALYNLAERDEAVARALVEGVTRFGAPLVLVAPEGSAMAQAARAAGVPLAREAFADRAYRPDGTLMPRREPGSVITDPGEVARRAVRLVTEGTVESAGGGTVAVGVDTICVHGDTPGAEVLAAAIRQALAQAGVEVAPFPSPAGDPPPPSQVA